MRTPHRLLLSLLLPALFLAAPGTARAADNGSWSVRPVSSAVAARPYFQIAADPGQTVRDEVVVTNRTAGPLTFRLYAADAYNTPRDGGFAVRGAEEPMRAVGAWARPAKDRITVPGHASVTVPFTLRVPEDAEPGDHPGAIVALDERTEKAAAGGVALGVRRAVGARVYLQVSGPALPALTVEDVRIVQHRPLVPGLGGSTATVHYVLRNTGNVTLAPRVRLTARGLFGRTLLDRDLTKVPAELLPGQKVELSEVWRGAPQLDRGRVTVTAAARDTRERAGASFLAVPWLVAAVVLALAGAAGALGVRARRARARRSVPARPSPPARPTPSRPRSSPSARP
ncbi:MULTISPECIES: WxL protein peptidoglycan domain-containing protein [unclassified Streptomyces]|uniref:WxL protein peptidoglycan domain-containing protein n=1 Tax=unclassified Streptomyces TaxID=2593676 RepID=UPI003D762FB0